MNDVTDVKLYLRKANGIEHFKEVPDDQLLFTQPTLLCCGGTQCGHDENGRSNANGFIKKAETLVNTVGIHHLNKSFQVAGVTYADGCMMSESIRAYNNNRMPPDMFGTFVDKQLVPLCTDKEGHKLPLAAVKLNFRNIQVLAHSFGGIFIQQVGNVLVDKMLKLGFTQQEIDEATSQIVVATMGSVADVHKGRANFKAVHIFNNKDAVAGGYSQNINIGRILAEERGQQEDSLMAMPFRYDTQERAFHIDQNSNQLIIMTNSSALDNSIGYRLNDSKNGNATIKPNGSGSLAESKGEWHEFSDPKYHENNSYFDYGLVKDGIMLRLAAAHVINNALANSIKNYSRKMDEVQPPPSLEKLLMSRYERTGAFMDFDPNQNFSKVAKAVGYELRMKSALHAEHTFKRLPNSDEMSNSHDRS